MSANRECGTCSLCCKLLGITELKKPAGKWCEHANVPGGGCKIYADRPHSCGVFACGWLVNPTFGDHWRPQRSKMVISINADGDVPVMQIYVDPSNREGWRKEPYYRDVMLLASQQERMEVRLSKPDDTIVLTS